MKKFASFIILILINTLCFSVAFWTEDIATNYYNKISWIINKYNWTNNKLTKLDILIAKINSKRSSSYNTKQINTLDKLV